MEVTVAEPESLDLEEYAGLQRASYAELLAGTGMESALRPELYGWKYRTASGSGKVALVRDGGALVAANAMFPVEVGDGPTRAIAWQSCDTATHPSARGRGLFTRCITALREALPADALFFGFPNHNSIRGFEKLGWQLRADVRTFARPLPTGATRRFHDVAPAAGEDESLDAFADALCAATGPTVRRTAAYLRWRYATHPVNRYEAFVLRDGGAVRGLVVIRRATVRGRELAAVMEALGLDRSSTRRVLRFASAWAAERGLRWVVAMGTSLPVLDAARAGFLAVPRRALPKRQVLMGAAQGPAARSLWARDWNVQLGDWDAF